MKEYRYSIIGKVEKVAAFILNLCILGGILFFIGMFDHLKYIVWIPFLWIVYYMSPLIMKAYVRFFVDAAGLTIKGPLGYSEKILWDNVQKVCSTECRSSILELRIFVEGQKIPRLILDRGIKRHQELFKTILANVKGKVERKKRL